MFLCQQLSIFAYCTIPSYFELGPTCYYNLLIITNILIIWIYCFSLMRYYLQFHVLSTASQLILFTMEVFIKSICVNAYGIVELSPGFAKINKLLSFRLSKEFKRHSPILSFKGEIIKMKRKVVKGDTSVVVLSFKFFKGWNCFT